MGRRGLQTSRVELAQNDGGILKKLAQLRCIELHVTYLVLIAMRSCMALGGLPVSPKLVPRRKRVSGDKADPESLRDLYIKPVVPSSKEPVNELNRVVPIKYTD
ncbi:hypothetical protein A7D17_02990 [Xanthomonas floridensis]|uniref:Uncharacterized protein n=1 Tax=Xanthomonas floridensis TaxID=1843580 RepID=A0A1A9MEQ7_9XANT|nr:hypothetical protein A7D17_02990 [Xanthomonas floridensis]